MKKCLKRLLQCSIVLLLLNCQSEDLALDSHEHSKLKIQRISLEELKSKPKALDALKKIREKSKTDAQAKLTYNSANDFYVDTEEIVYIEKEETHSYTFAVYRKQSTAYFENLVMTQQEDGSYSSTLVSYNLTEQERYDLEHEQLYSLDGKMSARVLDSGSLDSEVLLNRTSCTTIQIPTCSYHHTHFAGANCTKIDGSIDITICTDISEPHAPISYISPGGSGGSSGGGGGDSTPNTQTPITSQPTNPTPQPNPSNPIAQIGDITVPLIKPSPLERFIIRINNNPLLSAWWNDVQNAPEVSTILECINEYEPDFETAEEKIIASINGSAISLKPFFRYPTGSSYPVLYPKLTEYLMNKIPLLKNNSTIINAIKNYTPLSTSQIAKNLTWGKGPVIKIVQLDSFCTACDSNTYGLFQPTTDPNTLYIDIDLVNDLENSTEGTPLADSFAFLAGVTILHEFIHFGDNVDGVDYPGEEGELFEIDVYGQIVTRANAEIILSGN